MTKIDLCDVEETKKWIKHYENLGYKVLGVNLEKNTNLNNLINLTNEVMEEEKVTIDGVSHAVPNPFIVMATQNPKGSAGTQLLPESQLDRFMICMSIGVSGCGK